MDAAKKKSEKRVDILDLNLLPARYRRRKLSLHTVRLWFLMLAFAGLIYPSYLIYSEADAALRRQELKLAGIQQVLDEYEPLVEQKDELLAQIEEVTNQSLEIEAVAESATIQKVVWSEILQTIVNTIPQGIELISISQSDNEVLIIGLSENRSLPPDLMDDLIETGLFVDANIEYMVKQLVEETETEEVETLGTVPGFEFEILLDMGISDEEGG